MHLYSVKQAVIITLLSIFCLAACSSEQDAGPRPAPEVSIMTVNHQKVTMLMRLNGRASAFMDAEVRPQVSGIINKRLFIEGSYVEEGEELYHIDDAPYAAELANARARLMRAEANYVSAKHLADRYAEAVKIKGVSRQDYDNAVASAEQAKADVASAKAAVQSAEINLGYTKIKSPISGKVGISSVTQGALVTLNQPSPLTTVQQTDPMYLDVTQSSSDYLSIGKKIASGELSRGNGTSILAKIFLEDNSIYPYYGELLLRDITVNPDTGSYTIRVKIPNPRGILLPNMYMKAEIEEGINEKGVIIPQQALLRNQRGEPQVYILNKEGKVEIRKVTTNRVQYGQWIIDNGLEDGDQVIVEGLQKVRPGVTASAKPYEAPPAKPAEKEVVPTIYDEKNDAGKTATAKPWQPIPAENAAPESNGGAKTEQSAQ